MEIIRLEDLGESIIAVSPHDDDAVIGCGGLFSYAKSNGIYTSAVIMTDGRFGAPYVKNKDITAKTVKVRKKEANKAYGLIGLDDLSFLGFPDMGLELYKFFIIEGENGRHIDGSYEKLLSEVRRLKPETMFIPACSEIHEHVDHRSTHEISMFVFTFLADHPVGYDLGKPVEIKNIFEYEVWNKIGEPTHYFELPKEVQDIKKSAVDEFRSQRRAIKKLEIGWGVEKFRKLC